VLLAIIVAAVLEGRVSKRLVAQLGNTGALLGFIVIVISGILVNQTVFYMGVTLLGIGTGLSTVANLSLMFDLTVPGMVGLYIGAWASRMHSPVWWDLFSAVSSAMWWHKRPASR